ncbi:MAG: UDP-N-acetylmuramate dehydrogenase [Porticoccaceae bacterium]
MSLAIQQQISLQSLNSLALPAYAEYFCSVTDQQQLITALDYAREHRLPVTPLGGGSNLVLAGDIRGLVIALDNRGFSYSQSGDSVEVTFAAGENWHQCVLSTLQRGWYGMENLSLIPGNMGAAPIQNIGAYGVELADLFVSLRAVEIATGRLCEFDRGACQFGYRDSLFKNSARDQYIILDISLRLSTNPAVNISYPALKAAVAEAGLENNLTPQAVSELVCQVRQQKLPDPAVIPNAGSFFKNPVIADCAVAKLRSRYPEMPAYSQPQQQSKIPAAWLIDQCGFKGVRRGSLGVHKHQALVLVNYLDKAGGNGKQLLALADEICQAVWQRFSIRLEIEPRVYGLSEAG